MVLRKSQMREGSNNFVENSVPGVYEYCVYVYERRR